MNRDILIEDIKYIRKYCGKNGEFSKLIINYVPEDIVVADKRTGKDVVHFMKIKNILEEHIIEKQIIMREEEKRCI